MNDWIGDLNNKIFSLTKEIDVLKQRMEKHGISTPEQEAAEIARLKTALRKNGIPV